MVSIERCCFLEEISLKEFFFKVFLCFHLGGLSLKQQETELRARPDIVIATPGRLIDHVRNSPSFLLESIEILVIDEADR